MKRALVLLCVACGGVPRVDVDAGAPDAGNVPDSGSVPDAGRVTTVRVHYPTGARSLALRGSLAPLNWSTGVALTAAGNDTWTWSSSEISSSLEWKPLLDDSTWSRGPNYRVEAGGTVDVYPHFTTTQGTWSRRWPSFHSNVLDNDRGVWVYLPPTYVENATARFGVVYMHDGQNLFDPSAAFGGNPWRVQDAVDAAAETGAFPEVIVVGPENAGAGRISEYTPTADPSYGGGNGDAYLSMLVTELKPKVDAELRTLSDREHTAVLGSSLGGLISAYAGVKQAGTFGLIGAMSPSSWWDGEVLAKTFVPMTPLSPRPLRVYVDVGDDGVTETTRLAAAYRDAGYPDGPTFEYFVQPGAKHNETAWRQRLPGAFEFLLGRQ
jgi:predicted alpha/beta superfamily hydrolase